MAESTVHSAGNRSLCVSLWRPQRSTRVVSERFCEHNNRQRHTNTNTNTN